MRNVLAVSILVILVLTALMMSRSGVRSPLAEHALRASGQQRSAGLLRTDSASRSREWTLRRIAQSDTYLPAMLAQSDSMLKRWPDRTVNPLIVFLPEGGQPGYTPDLGQAARNAFSRWERVAGIPVTFTFTRDSSRADVIVRWITEFPMERTGQADVRWNRAGWLLSGTLTLATRNPGGIVLPPAAVYTVALHEIGHLLGLGHSDDSADVMYPTTDPREDISSRDRRTARLLYELAPGPLRSP